MRFIPLLLLLALAPAQSIQYLNFSPDQQTQIAPKIVAIQNLYPEWASKIIIANTVKQDPRTCEINFNAKRYNTFTIYIFPSFYASTNQQHELVKALVRAHNAQPTNFVRPLLSSDTLKGYNLLYEQTVDEFAKVLEAQLSPY